MKILDNKRKLDKLIRKSKNIFIISHKNLDLDAIGSSIGMFNILEKKHKNCYLILEDKKHEAGVEKILNELEGCLNIIKTNKIKDKLYDNPKNNLLIILDTNKKSLLQSEEAVKYFDNIVIIDHHEYGKESLKNGLIIIDNNASSTCEMIATYMENKRIVLTPYYATLVLAGIVLDTNNFTLKTTKNTYYSAYYLACLGASPKKVQYLLKQDLKDYIQRQKLFANIEVLPDKIAFAKGTSEVIYRREDLAKVADTLLFFNNTEASFVIGKLKEDTVGISARSMGNFDINKVLSKLGGGGTQYNGAAQLDNATIYEAEKLLKKELKKLEGED